LIMIKIGKIFSLLCKARHTMCPMGGQPLTGLSVHQG
jgi:hypothetical protein